MKVTVGTIIACWIALIPGQVHADPLCPVSWSSTASVPGQNEVTALYSVSGTLYGVGVNPLTQIYAYDVAANTWTALATPRNRYFVGTAASSQKLWILGGTTNSAPGGAENNWMDEVDLTTNISTPMPDMPTGGWGASSIYYNNTVFAFGRATSISTIIGTVEAFSTTLNAWSARTSLPVPVAYSAVAQVGGLIYVLGGSTSSAITDTVQVYDPNLDSWTVLSTHLPVPRYNAQATLINGKIVFAGGYVPPGSTNDNSVQAFDPSDNSVQTLAPLPAAGSNFGCAYHLGILYTEKSGSMNYAGAFSCPSGTNTQTPTFTPTPSSTATAIVPSCLGNYLSQWGGAGTGNGQFNLPDAMALDTAGNLYVTDNNNLRIQKFDSNGNYLTQWPSPGGPKGIALDSLGFVYVSSLGNNEIYKYSSTGTLITQWATGALPTDVAVDSTLGRVYVPIQFGTYIQVFTTSGTLVTQFGSTGSGDGQFNSPGGIAVDASSNIYVADGNNNRIQKLDSNGVYLSQWGSNGTGNGQFTNGPQNLAFDSSGNLYATDITNNRIEVFTSNGGYLGQFGSTGTGNGQFNTLYGVAVASNGTIYASDSNGQRIQVFGCYVSPTPTISPTATSTITASPTSTSSSTVTASPTVSPSPSATFCVAYRDDFNGPSFNPDFTWIDPVGDVTPVFSAGNLSYTLPAGRNFWSGANFNAPRLGHTISGDFVAETHVTCTAATGGLSWFVGLCAITNNSNQLGTQLVNLQGSNPTNANHEVLNGGGSAVPIGQTTAWFRLQRSGSTYTSSYSLDGIIWSQIYIAMDTTDPVFVGILAKTDLGIVPVYDYLQISVPCALLPTATPSSSATTTSTASPSSTPTQSTAVTYSSTTTTTPSPSPTFTQSKTVSPSPTVTATATDSPTAVATASVPPTQNISPTANIPDPGDTPYVYPQPFKCGGNVAVNMHKPGRVKVSMLSNRGNVEAHQEFSCGAGVNRGRFDCDGLGNGLKFMLVEIDYDDGEKVRLKPVRIGVAQ